jgi:phosphopantetheinyl transferase (holo-ACP synthase)
MIGNDIVDLNLARKESNWQRKGFLDKIFTENEQVIINKSINPEHTVWELWSRKEAVYKIYNRQTQNRFFNPKKIECINNNQVKMFGQIYFTRTQTTSNYIYSEAVIEPKNFKRIKEIKRTKNCIKINGIPRYKSTKNAIEKLVSITNHGAFEKTITFQDVV